MGFTSLQVIFRSAERKMTCKEVKYHAAAGNYCCLHKAISYFSKRKSNGEPRESSGPRRTPHPGCVPDRPAAQLDWLRSAAADHRQKDLGPDRLLEHRRRLPERLGLNAARGGRLVVPALAHAR